MTAGCSVPSCPRGSRSGGMCEMHYHAEYRTRTGHAITCQHCGAAALKPSKGARFCSKSCAMSARPRGKRSSPLSDAVRAGDRAEVMQAVRDLCDTSSGCWIWQRRLNQYGYANASVEGKHRLVHRIVLEAKIGRPLGKEQAHHACAVPACVNPGHLVPASQAENIAEMHARNAMEYRIRSLEAAVRELDPKHPLLASDLAFL